MVWLFADLIPAALMNDRFPKRESMRCAQRPSLAGPVNSQGAWYYPVVPPHTDYTLTPIGLEAAEKIESLANWIEEALPRIMENHAVRQKPPSAHS